MITVIVERVRHDSGMRVALKFPSDEEIVNIIRTLPDATWDKRMNCWHISESKDINAKIVKELIGVARIEFRSGKTRKLIEKVREIRERNSVGLFHRGHVSHLSGGFPSESDINDKKLSKTALDDIERYRSWLNSHRYPPTTVRTYTSMMVTFLRFVSPREASECNTDDLVRMVNEYVLERGLSYSFQNQLISSVKKFYKEICREVIDPGEFTRPRTRHKLPNVLSKEEVKKILMAPMNEKHKAILSIIYGCGLRRSEVITLELEDIDRDRMLLSVRQSKGFKDRIVPVSVKLVEMIDSYVSRYRPVVYLFEGQRQGERYSAASIEKVFRVAAEKAGIKKSITLHGLRHSYATHLLESGTDLRYIQELLGHKSSRTTEIYTHVTEKSIQKIRTPFDDL
jgi:integrase/recombinase XerD